MEHRGRYRWRLHICLKSVICMLWVEWHFSPLWKLPFKIMAPRSEEAEAIITRLVPVKKKTCVWWGGCRITFHEELCLTMPSLHGALRILKGCSSSSPCPLFISIHLSHTTPPPILFLFYILHQAYIRYCGCSHALWIACLSAYLKHSKFWG